LFGAGITTGGFSAATGGATTRIITTPDLDIVQDQVVSAVGSYSATASLSGSAAWVMQLVALRGTSAASTLAARAPAASTLPVGGAAAPAALAPQPTQAAQARCLAGKTSCVSKTVNELLKCARRASTPGKPTDRNAKNCLDKAKAKFDGGADPAKGCFEELEKNKSSKKQPSDCLTFDDAADLESAIDGCVADWVAAIDPGRQSKCGAGKIKCLAKLASGVLKCHQAAQTPGKPDDLNVQGCIDKVTVKFTGGETPDRGCFEKLEGKLNNDCGTFDDTATLEAAVNSCVLDFLSRPTSTTTTTTTPTSTKLRPAQAPARPTR